MSDTEQANIIGVRTVLKLNTKLRSVTDPHEVLSVIARELRDVLNADNVVIALFEPEKNVLRVGAVAVSSPSDNVSYPEIKVDENFRKRVFDPGTPRTIRIGSIAELPAAGRDLAVMTGINSVVISTISLRGDFIGYIGAGSKQQGHEFPPDTESIMTAVSDYFCIVLDNIRANMLNKRAREDTENLLALAPIGIFICNSKGIFESVNKQMLGFLDRSSEADLVGTSVFEVPSIIKSGLDVLITQGIDGHEGEKSDVHIVPKSDKAFYLHAKVTPIRSSDGQIEKILFVAMDVSSKVRLQNQLERSYEKLTQTYDELERVTKMKTQFIDIVSHELRTPLTVMRGYIELVESEYSSKLDPKFGSRLAIIKANTDRLYTLVESMLDVSRLEKGAMQIHPEPVKIDVLLQDVVNARMKDVEAKKQSITLDLDSNLPLIMADRRRLKDVFSNVIDNAVKYTQENGKIQVGARDEGKMLHVWVKDNGIGIPLENLGKLFDRFHIVTRNELSHQVDRLGLGLPISKGIIEAHGGRIWVESQVGKGSVFHVDLPKSPPK